MFNFGNKNKEKAAREKVEGSTIETAELMPNKAGKSDPDFRVLRVGTTFVNFRSKTIYPVNSFMFLRAKGPTNRGIQEQTIKLEIKSCKVVGAKLYEYHADLHDAPIEFERWINASDPTTKHGHKAEAAVAATVATDNKRRAERLNLTFQVTSKGLAGFRALSADISSTGIRLTIGEEILVGRVLDMHLDFDDFKFPRIAASGEVVWCRSLDAKKWIAGLRFVDLPDEEQDIIDSYLSYVDKYRKKFS